jgi:hypothetical protein
VGEYPRESYVFVGVEYLAILCHAINALVIDNLIVSTSAANHVGSVVPFSSILVIEDHVVAAPTEVALGAEVAAEEIIVRAAVIGVLPLPIIDLVVCEPIVASFAVDNIRTFPIVDFLAAVCTNYQVAAGRAVTIIVPTGRKLAGALACMGVPMFCEFLVIYPATYWRCDLRQLPVPTRIASYAFSAVGPEQHVAAPWTVHKRRRPPT